MVESDNANQNNFKSNQNFKADILKIYNSFIKPIDEMRSKTNVTSPKNQGIINKQIDKTGARAISVRSLLKPEIDYQESRCHTFYRLIGFPVYNGTLKYSPGFDKHFSKNKNIKIIDKENIIAKPIDGFNKLSDKREEFAQNFLSLFSNNTSIDACTIALSSSASCRSFIDPLIRINNDLSEEGLNPDQQSYDLLLLGRVGNYKVKYPQYVGPSGIPSSKLKTKRYHIITPFLVDARYEITVPTKQMVAVPFVLNSSMLKASETINVKRPWIEKIIEDRLLVSDATDLAKLTTIDVIHDFIRDNPDIQDEELVTKVLNNYATFSITQQEQFMQFIHMIRSMIIKLVEAQYEIKKVQNKYYWLPIPSKTGPEKGSSVRPLIISKEISDKKILTTSLDFEMMKALLIKMSNETLKKYKASSESASESKDFIFSGDEFVTAAFDAQNTNAEDSVSATSYDDLNSSRTQLMTSANVSLQIIEIIMGEFSGLGLCDILAIIASLYVIPIEDLLGFLDDDALERSQNTLKVFIVPSLLEKSMESLTSTVIDFYNLMDKIYLDYSQKNTRP